MHSICLNKSAMGWKQISIKLLSFAVEWMKCKYTFSTDDFPRRWKSDQLWQPDEYCKPPMCLLTEVSDANVIQSA